MLNPLTKKLRDRVSAWWQQAQLRAPRGFTACVLMAAVLLAMAHYTFGDKMIYPEIALWKERAFWAVVPTVVCVSLLHWLVWTVMIWIGRLKPDSESVELTTKHTKHTQSEHGRHSQPSTFNFQLLQSFRVVRVFRGSKEFSQLKPAQIILTAAAILCLGDLVWYLVWINLKAVGLDYQRFVDYWDWWAYWMPVVVLAGNLFLARRWWKLFRPAQAQEAVASAILDDVEPGFQPGGETRASMTVSVKLEQHSRAGELSGRQDAALYGRSGGPPLRFNLILRTAAAFLAWCAVVLTAIHLLLPRMAVNDFTLAMADTFLVREEWKKDFDFVVRNSVSRGKRLGALLEQASLAHLQRRHFYPDLNETIYQEFVLSPVVDRLPLSELDWRRTLWENFYPRVRRERDPALAAQAVVRYLRERVGIDPAYSYRVGVETIWTQQMTDENGFERIYVAALRSVGIAARLNAEQRAELWSGNAWHEAARPIIASWSTSSRKKT